MEEAQVGLGQLCGGVVPRVLDLLSRFDLRGQCAYLWGILKECSPIAAEVYEARYQEKLKSWPGRQRRGPRRARASSRCRGRCRFPPRTSNELPRCRPRRDRVRRGIGSTIRLAYCTQADQVRCEEVACRPFVRLALLDHELDFPVHASGAS
jgi:hypothetical protein